MICITNDWCVPVDFSGIVDAVATGLIFTVLGSVFFGVSALFLIMKFYQNKKPEVKKRSQLDWSRGYDRLVSWNEMQRIKSETEMLK